MTAETAAISVTRTECVVRYTLPIPTRAPLTTASKHAVVGPPFGGRGLLGGAAGTGAELPTHHLLVSGHVNDAPSHFIRLPQCLNCDAGI
jgi:hypothetical protein